MKKIIVICSVFCMILLSACGEKYDTTIELISTEVDINQVSTVTSGYMNDDDSEKVTTEQPKPDKATDAMSSEEFERALNNGENCDGKTVTFVVNEVHPDSAFGYNLWAGEHLNFVSDDASNAKVGDEVTVKVDKVESVLGSWIIYYSN